MVHDEQLNVLEILESVVVWRCGRVWGPPVASRACASVIRPAERVRPLGRLRAEEVVVIVVVHVLLGSSVAVGLANELHVGVQLIDAIRVDIVEPHDATIVVLSRIVRLVVAGELVAV